MPVMSLSSPPDGPSDPIRDVLPLLRGHYAPEIAALKRHARRRTVRRLVLGGAVLAVLGAGGGYGAFGWQRVAAPANRPLHLALDQGGMVHLDAGAVIHLPIWTARRQARLEQGTALFDIRHDDHHPFVVHSGAAVITDLGTRFWVHTQDGGAHVAVFEGRVALAAAGRSLDLPVGSAGRGDADGVAPRVMPDPSDMEWSRDRLVFRDAPLAQVAASLGRYGDFPVLLGSPDLEPLRVNGSFRLGDTAAALVMLEQGLPLVVVREPDRIVLLPKKTHAPDEVFPASLV